MKNVHVVLEMNYVAPEPSDLTVPTTLYKYRSLNKNSLASLLCNEIYFSKPQDFDDPFERVKTFEKSKVGEAFAQLLDLSGVLCLCETSKSLSMWSYYGAGLRGFAVGYDTCELLKSINSKDEKIPDWKYVHKVEYNADNKIPNIEIEKLVDSDDSNRHPQKTAMFATKANIYAHETEYRIVLLPEPDSKDSASGLRQHSPQSISQIIFGELISPGDEKTIREALRGKTVIYKRAMRSHEQFEIVIVDT
jgi:Protein of unknown function (DUF2971)